MNNFWLNNLLTDPFNLICLLVGLIAIFHLLFVWPRNLSKKQWKIIDYIWLTVAASGLISLSSDARVTLANSWSNIERESAIYKFEQIQSLLKLPEHGYVCRTFIRDENSADDLDLIQKEHDLTCEWIKKISTILLKQDTTSIPELSIDNIPQLNINFSQEALLERKTRIERSILEYISQRNRYISTINKTKKREFESDYYFYSPLFLCIAIALRITKVTGEMNL